MKILLITPQLPYPPRQGTTIRNFNLLRSLAQRHTVDLLSFLAPGDSAGEAAMLSELTGRFKSIEQPHRGSGRRVISSLSQRLPDMALRLESPEMRLLVSEWVADGSYDIVQTEGIELAQYGRLARTVAPSVERPVWVFDNHNCEYLLQKRAALTDLARLTRLPAGIYSLLQWWKLIGYERTVCRAADVVLAVSPQDATALQTLAGRQEIATLVNGIAIAEFPWSMPRPQQPPTLVFTGKMDYRPNIDAALWFGDEVLPLIQAREPAVQFLIVGMNPHPRLDPLRSNPAIEITGTVADTKPFIRAASVFVIPMRVGGGTRFKVLEAMALGAPVVSTTLGVEGIEVSHGQELLIADTPTTFAEMTLKLLQDYRQDSTNTAAISTKARTFVADHFSWDEIIPQLESIYLAALG